METAVWILAILFSIVFHEVAHGLAAYALGDTTAKNQGRLTLNPLKHIDPFWTVILPVFLYISTHGRFVFGMAKPVPVNFSRLSSPRAGMIAVALAGPLANVLMAFVLSRLWFHYQAEMLLLTVYLNIGLAVFNLIPIPPLDGSRVLTGLLPAGLARAYLSIDRWGFIIVMLLSLSGILYHILAPGMQLLAGLLGVPVIAAENFQ